MSLQNKASHWEGETLILVWRVLDCVGFPLTEWGTRAYADRMYGILVRSEGER